MCRNGKKIKKEPNTSATNTDDNPTTALAIAATTNVLATSSILQAPEPVIQSLSLEAIQAEMQTEFRAAAQGLHETITSEVEPAEVRTGLGLGYHFINCMTSLNDRVEGPN
jgi:hypothetical protein